MVAENITRAIPEKFPIYYNIHATNIERLSAH
jgi:hypothetical protein